VKASEFILTYGKRGLAAWEAAIALLAKAGQLSIPSLAAVPVKSANGNLTGTVLVTSDYVTVGEPGDQLRIPLTPASAQAVANAYGGALLPTRKLVKDTWQASAYKLEPHPEVPNKGSDMTQYAEHSTFIDSQLSAKLAESGELVSGIKKDVVVSNIYKPGKVVIYGWLKPDGSPVQPLSNVHGDFYVDYSHGVRLVAPTMTIDGQGEVLTENVYKDPVLSSLVSDEGSIRTTRYPTTTSPSNVAPQKLMSFKGLLVQGLQALVYYAGRKRTA
jgi:hypothetical protein